MYRVLALDVGTKRIGIALSDALLITANPVTTIPRQPENEAVNKILALAKENRVEKIVVGLPLNMDNSKGFQAKDCEEFAKKILGYDIIFEDERLTSEEAEERLRQKKIDFRKNKGLVDMMSATIILEQYLRR